MTSVQIYPDPQTLAKAAAEQFVKIAENAIQARGIFNVALSGGSTPQTLYHLLANEPFSERVNWDHTHIFWGDERCVPPYHTESNYLKARQILLDRVPLPEQNIHRIPAELKPEQAAEAYQEMLLQYFSALADEQERNKASFDLVLLGMGDDGHTASLFSGTEAVHEQVRWVMAHYVDRMAAWRITLTPAILNRADNILFLVAGAGKSLTLQKVIYGTFQPDRYPSQAIRPEEGKLTWLIDEAAAALV